MNPDEKHTYPWGHARPFNAYANYSKKQWGARLQKVSVDAGFTCPNRDGKLGTKGCTYCNNKGFSPAYCGTGLTIAQQLEKGMAFLRKRYKKNSRFVAYFQAYSNTYAPIGELEEKYMQALSVPGIEGLAIGTRPDCLSKEVLELLASLNEKVHVSVELGIESCYDDSLRRINRGHSFAQSREAIIRLKEHGLEAGGHFIFGLPGESHDMMLNSADCISALPLDKVKFHQLQIIKGTQMAREYQENPCQFELFSFEGYLGFIIRFLERLRPGLMIERLAGEAPPSMVENPGWGLRSHQVQEAIEKQMLAQNTRQGKKYVHNAGNA